MEKRVLFRTLHCLRGGGEEAGGVFSFSFSLAFFQAGIFNPPRALKKPRWGLGDTTFCIH